MRLEALMQKGALAGAARKANLATVATLATIDPYPTRSVAHVANVAALPNDLTLPDVASVTEALTDAERRAIVYCERIARDRKTGRVPDSYTATTWCRGCGTVPIFEGAPARVDACPWCFNRAKGLPIPRPTVSCGACAHFTSDSIGHGGIGSCAANGPPGGQMPAYPHIKRQCPEYRPNPDDGMRRHND